MNIQIDNRHSDTTVVIFSGMAPKNHVYEWTASFADFPANVVGVRDPFDRWYQVGCDTLAARLNGIVDQLGRRWVVCVGASAGGFAALLYGRALCADRVLAFCPQSACGEAKRALGDMRWPECCQETPSHDLTGAYPGALVHYAIDNDLDAMHADRIDCARMVWPYGGHDLPYVLKRNGVLHSALAGAMA